MKIIRYLLIVVGDIVPIIYQGDEEQGLWIDGKKFETEEERTAVARVFRRDGDDDGLFRLDVHVDECGKYIKTEIRTFINKELMDKENES